MSSQILTFFEKWFRQLLCHNVRAGVVRNSPQAYFTKKVALQEQIQDFIFVFIFTSTHIAQYK